MLATALGAGAVFVFKRIGSTFYAATVSVCAGVMGFSSGTMTYVVFFELVPDAIKNENRRLTLTAFIAGVAVAYGLSTLLGF
jgi:zinc transporter ZupT